MYRKIQLVFLAVCVLSPLLSGCLKTNDDEISTENLAILKSKYGGEVINYFYETVFHEDFKESKSDNISKWKTNPKIVLVGNPSSIEIGYVKKAILEVNKLNLPIKCSLGNATDSSSISIFFGDANQVGVYLKLGSLEEDKIDDVSGHTGIAHSVSYDGEISKANIGICYTKNDTTQSVREKVVLEEIIQSLGVVGDSYTYPGSLFFEKENPDKSFTALDRQVLALLYDPIIPINYSRKSFEDGFSDVLYSEKPSEKIKNLLAKYSEDSFKDVDIENCFINGVILKHPKETNVYLCGEIQKEDSATVTKAIISINKITPNLNLKLVEPKSLEPGYGIILTLKELSQQKESIRVTNQVIAGKNCMFQKIIKNRVLLSFNGSERSKKLKQQSLVDVLYLSLMQVKHDQKEAKKLFNFKNGNVEFEERYATLLKLIYSNEFVDGLKISDFRESRL